MRSVYSTSIGSILLCLAAFAATPSGNDSCRAQTPLEQPFASDISTPVDFSRDVIPVLTQAGCNSGACHGAAAGRGYLALSLFGSRPEADYETLLYSVPGRFVDVQQPAASLILQKPGGFVEHGGGERLDSHGAAFALLQQWISQNAPRGKLAELRSLSISPGTIIDAKVSEPIRLSVASTWSDGSTRESTRWATVADAQPLGAAQATVEYRVVDNVLELTPRAVGYWPITIRVGKQALTVQLFVSANNNARVVPPRIETQSPTATPLLQSHNSIDAIVFAANQRLELQVAGRSSAPLLARRLWLDLAGRHPSVKEWSSAIRDIDQGQVAGLVDRLLASDEFSEHAGSVLASWVGAHSRAKLNSDLLAAAISTELLQSDDLQQLVRHMLLVPADPAETPTLAALHPLTAFHQFAGDPRQRAELIAATWLGVRIGCAQCHDHPLDHWTQDDYFAMAACWAEIDVAGTASSVRRLPSRTTTDLRNGRDAVARLPFAMEPFEQSVLGPQAKTTADRAFVDWLCDSSNEQFSRNLANRVWAWLLGSGLVKELDDHRITNPAIHQELLEHLAAHLRSHKFSLRSLVRTIVLSDTYARVVDSDASQLHRQMLASREVKSIHRDTQQLASDAFGFTNDKVSKVDQPVLEMAMEMQAVTAAEEGCARQQPCKDPFAESLELVVGNRLNRLIAAAVEKASQHRQSPLDLLNQFHVQLFGSRLSAEEATQLQQWLDIETTRLDQNDLPVVEDIVWSWVVSPTFRQQH